MTKKIKNHFDDVTDIIMIDFIHSKGLQNEYESYLGKKYNQIANGEVDYGNYKIEVCNKILGENSVPKGNEL